MLKEITPVILTYNEAPNIGRCLSMLGWARDIVVVDSGSTDGTLDILAQHPRVRVFRRAFDAFKDQWNFALESTGILHDWVLTLDADYVLTQELTNEISRLDPSAPAVGYRAGFTYCVFGKPLRATVYPPRPVLLRRSQTTHRNDGHAQKAVVNGELVLLREKILHDDHKAFDRWIASQNNYMRQESQKLLESKWTQLSWADRLRKHTFLAAPIMFFYLLVIKGLILDGSKGLYYVLQRTLAEIMLSTYIWDAALRHEKR